MTDLTALKAALATMTPGPWAWEATGEKSNDWAIGLAWSAEGKSLSGRVFSREDMVDDIMRGPIIGDGDNNLANPAGIVALVNAAPALLARLEELVAERDALRTAIKTVLDSPAMMGGEDIDTLVAALEGGGDA